MDTELAPSLTSRQAAAWSDGLAPRRPLTEDPRREALERVLASRTFARTTRLASFLRYVCIASLEGRSASLSEQHIGHRVFDRPEQYNPADDTIVRTTARLLRLRLATYYAAEGLTDPLRIVVPRGGYAPVFLPAERAEAMSSEVEAPPPATGVGARDEPLPQADTKCASWRLDRLWGRLPRPVAVGAVLAFAAVAILYAFSPHTRSLDLADVFWGSLLSPERDTLLVPADTALVNYQQTVHHEVSLEDYAARRLATGSADAGEGDPASMSQFRSHRHTAVTSVALAAEFGKLAQRAPKRFQVRFARDLQLADLKQSNAILVGVRQANPWVALFRNRVNFHIDWDSASGNFLVRNDRPLSGERALYEFSSADPGRRAYASIAYLRGLSGDAQVLLLGGTTAAGTEAAAEFLLDPRRLDAVLQRARLPDGSVGEFEVLLQSLLQANGSTDIQVLGMRTHQP